MSKALLTLWNQIPITLNQLCIATVLRSGQSFRWKNASGVWSCGFPDRIISLRQDPTHLYYRAHYSKAPKKDDTLDVVMDYFNLKVDLESLYEKWAKADSNFKEKAGEFRGVRMLQQDPWECLIGFICSSNNNIGRISKMVDALCSNFGTLLGTLPIETMKIPDNDENIPPTTIAEPTPFYSFPAASALTSPDLEATLRNLGFGYRAKYIAQTALLVANERPKNFLNDLRDKSTYREAHEALLEFSGVGPKVADCVCLMSLDKMEAVPVDTHVWQIAQRDYKFNKGSKFKSLTKPTYDAVGDHFRNLWGNEAGWAHSVLFTADLRAFSERLELTKKVKVEVDGDGDEHIKVEETLVKVGDGVDTKVETSTIETQVSKGRKRTINGKIKIEKDEFTNLPKIEDIAASGRKSSRRRT